MNTNSSAPPSEIHQALSIISAALQPQASGQITREGWANIHQALGVISWALDEGDRAIQEREKFWFEREKLNEQIQLLETEKASLYEAYGNALEKIKELKAGALLESARDDKEILLRAALKDANDMCRSFWNVVERNGGNTNWEGLRGELKRSLEKQHAAMHQIGGSVGETEFPILKDEYGLPSQYQTEIPRPESVIRSPLAGSIAKLPLAILAFFLFLLPSCVHYSKQTAAGEKTSFTAIATNATEVRAGELSIASMNQSEGVKEIGSAIGAIVKTQITGRLIGSGIDAAKSATNNAIEALDTP